MEVRYRKSFLRDLKKLKKHPRYAKIHDFAFRTLPDAKSLATVPGVRALAGHAHRYRVRIGSYRIGIQVEGSTIELVRVLNRRDFYRYFP